MADIQPSTTSPTVAPVPRVDELRALEMEIPKPQSLNGVLTADVTASNSVSEQVSREASVLANVANTKADQLMAADDSNDEGELSAEEDLQQAALVRPSLPYSSLPTGLCYDSRMRFHTELDPPKDRTEYHPEDPRRIFWIYKTLCQAGLVDDSNLSVAPLVAQPLRRLPARAAQRDEILLVHEEPHFNFLKETALKSDEELIMIEKRYDSIYYNQSTYMAALLSAGSAIDTCLAVAESKVVKNAIAVIRPPGHHACADQSMGFCHFDNVSVAARVVQRRNPHVRRILIVDWDVHHGNGIQQAFESDPNVLYISIHVHQDGNFYPSGPYGDHLHCGFGAGLGKNINIPWPTKGMGDADYLYAFQHVVMPVATDFNPDFVIIAAGFDAAVGDQLGGCFVTPDCYSHMTHMLMGLAGGRLVACLEGGYNLNSIASSALAVTKTLMGEAPPRIADTAATQSCVDTVRKVIAHQSRYWKCLSPRPDVSNELEVLPGLEIMHDIVRAYQSSTLYDKFKMINLWVYREKQSRSFDNQVLATPGYAGEAPLLLIFHDPPEIIGQPNPITGQLSLHHISMADTVKDYISFAIKHGFSVIDVNVPKFLTGISNPEDPDRSDEVVAAAEELAIYIWENYVECNDPRKVILMGVGDAYDAVLHILNTRTWDNIHQYAGTVAFVKDHTLKPVSESFMTDFGRRFSRSSLVHTTRDHTFWAVERKKISRKYGRLVRSDALSLNAMMDAHRPDVEKFLLECAGLPPLEPTIQVGTVEEDGDTVMLTTSVAA